MTAKRRLIISLFLGSDDYHEPFYFVSFFIVFAVSEIFPHDSKCLPDSVKPPIWWSHDELQYHSRHSKPAVTTQPDIKIGAALMTQYFEWSDKYVPSRLDYFKECLAAILSIRFGREARWTTNVSTQKPIFTPHWGHDEVFRHYQRARRRRCRQWWNTSAGSELAAKCC